MYLPISIVYMRACWLNARLLSSHDVLNVRWEPHPKIHRVFLANGTSHLFPLSLYRQLSSRPGGRASDSKYGHCQRHHDVAHPLSSGPLFVVSTFPAFSSPPITISKSHALPFQNVGIPAPLRQPCHTVPVRSVSVLPPQISAPGFRLSLMRRFSHSVRRPVVHILPYPQISCTQDPLYFPVSKIWHLPQIAPYRCLW